MLLQLMYVTDMRVTFHPDKNYAAEKKTMRLTY